MNYPEKSKLWSFNGSRFYAIDERLLTVIVELSFLTSIKQYGVQLMVII